MEMVIGRYLTTVEVVHHEDDNAGNNSPDNLKLFANNAEHKKYHNANRLRDEKGRMLKRKL